MLRFDNADLPTADETLTATNGGSAFRLYNGSSRTLAPIVRYSTFTGNFEPVVEPIEIPDFSGYYYRIGLGLLLHEVQTIYTNSKSFAILNTPLLALPDHAWGATDGINIYAFRESLSEGDAIGIQLVATTTTPEPTNNTYTIDISEWGDFAATSVQADGLTFTPAIDEGNPQVGEFVQGIDDVVVYGSDVMRLRPTAEMRIVGTLQEVVPTATAAVFTFDLSQTAIEFVDGIDYLGITFTPASDPSTPGLREFFWFAPILNVFVDLNIGGGVQSRVQGLNGVQAIGTTSYERFE